MTTILPQLNTIDSLMTLMSYMEILDNQHHSIRRAMMQSEEDKEQVLFLLERNVILNIGITRECIDYLFTVSNNKKSLSKLPPLESLITEGSINNLGIVRWIERNYDRENDEILITPIQLIGHFDATRIVIWKGCQNIIGKDQVKLAIDFLRLFHARKALQSLVEHNIAAKVSSDWSKLELGDLSPEEILEKENFHPRTFYSAATEKFPQWKDNVMKINEETLMSTELSANDPKQRQLFTKEHRTYFNEFAAIPGFAEKFYQETNISLDDYSEISLALQRLALEQDPPVIYYPSNKVIRKVKQKCGRSQSQIVKVLEMFTRRPGEVIRDKRFFYDGKNYIYNWSMIVIPFHKVVERIYRDFIDGNFQGLEFEKECRGTLQRNGCEVFDERLVIEQQIIPEEISMKLWGSVKKKTDLDVIGTKENCLFIIECKSEVQRLQRRTSQLNMFGKYHEELLHKAEWIANNMEQFRQLLYANNFKLSEALSYIIPVLLGSFNDPYNQEMIITPRELNEVIRQLPKDFSGTELLTRIDNNIELKLPAFRIGTRILQS